MSNLSVLESNIIAGLMGACVFNGECDHETFDEAENIFLRHLDKHAALGAEYLALRWIKVGRFLSSVLPKACAAYCDQGRVGAEYVVPDLRNFIKTRYENLVKGPAGGGK